MANSLDSLHAAAAELSNRLGCAARDQISFTPCVDLRYGDYQSDGAFHLSRQKRVPVEQAGKELLESFPEELRQHLSLRSGFLNFRIPDVFECIQTYRPRTVGWTATAIVLPHPTPAVCGWEYLQVIANGIVQIFCARMFERSLSLILPPSVAAAAEKSVGVVMREFVQLAAKAKENVQPVEWSDQDYPVNGEAIIWSHPALKDDAGFIEFSALENSVVIYPRGAGRGGEWTTVGDDIDPSIEGRVALCLAFYLAHPGVRQRFDSDIPHLKTTDNLLWFITSLEQRARRLIGERSLETHLFADDLSVIDRRPLVRSIQIGDLFLGAGQRGQVPEMLLVVEEIARSFARRLNTIAFAGTFEESTLKTRIASLAESRALGGLSRSSLLSAYQL